jgi:hypothetical protein
LLLFGEDYDVSRLLGKDSTSSLLSEATHHTVLTAALLALRS